MEEIKQHLLLLWSVKKFPSSIAIEAMNCNHLAVSVGQDEAQGCPSLVKNCKYLAVSVGTTNGR